MQGFFSSLHDQQVHRQGSSAGEGPVLIASSPPLLVPLALADVGFLQNMGGSASSPTHSGYWGSSGNLIQQNLDAQALLAQQQALSMLQSSSGLDRQVSCLQDALLAPSCPACLSEALSLCSRCPLVQATSCRLSASAEHRA